MSLSTSLAALWPQLTTIALVGFSHMSLPTHWLPYVVTSRAHHWSIRKTLFLTLLGALGHVTNTLFISLLISRLGSTFISHDQYRLLASVLLCCGGLYYVYSYLIRRKRSSCCERPRSPPPTSEAFEKDHPKEPSDEVIISKTAEVSVVMLTTLSPCVGSMPVLLTIMSPPLNLWAVSLCAFTLASVTVCIMCSFVAISLYGFGQVNMQAITRHERLYLGIGLVILAAITMFAPDNHNHQNHHHDADGLPATERTIHAGCHGHAHSYDHVGPLR